MRLTLYYNSSERRVIGKSLQSVGTVTGVLKGDASILNPTFILETSGNYLSDINYLYWQEAGRYYFIDDIMLMTGGRTVLSCSVDVLESFSSQILSQSAMIDKQTSLGSLYINDGSWIHESRSFYTIKNFPNGFNDQGSYILITAG